MPKTAQHIIWHNCCRPSLFRSIQWIRFMKISIKTLGLVNVKSDNPPVTIIRFSTIEKNIIHHLKIEINRIIIGITSTGRNTSYHRSNTNYLWFHTFKDSSCSTWWWQFTASKCTSTGVNNRTSTWKIHKPPSQQEQNNIPDEQHTTPTILSPMFQDD